jgi:hypothetical protein
LTAGVAVSTDGINWLRGDGLVEGHRSAAEQYGDVGVVLGPNSDNWWTMDTAHLTVSDVQVWCDLQPQALGGCCDHNVDSDAVTITTE